MMLTRVLCVSACAALCFALPALADAPARAPTQTVPPSLIQTPPDAGDPLPEIHFDSIADLELWVDMTTDLAWSIRESSLTFGADLMGRSMEQYVQEWVFTAQARQEIESALGTARQQTEADDQAGLAETLAKTSAQADLQLARLYVIGRHFSYSNMVRKQQAALAEFSARVPKQEATATSARIEPHLARYRDAADAQLRQALAHPTPRPNSIDPELLAALNGERIRLAELVTKADELQGIPPRSVTRSTPCEPPHPLSRGDTPSVDRTTVDQPRYPDDARRFGFEGTLKLRALVSELGCAERVELVGPVGYEPLDTSALEWGANLRFHPASRDGKPVAASYTFAVTFRLHD